MRIPFLSRSKGDKAIDPVCKMEVDPKSAPGGKYDYQGQTYYFCAPGCRRNFEKDPEKYLKGGDQGMAEHGHHM